GKDQIPIFDVIVAAVADRIFKEARAEGLVLEEGIAAEHAVFVAPAMVDLNVILLAVGQAAGVPLEVIGVGEWVARSAIWRRIEIQDLLSNRVQTVRWNYIAGERIANKSGAVRVGAGRGRIVNRNQHSLVVE